MYTEDRGDELEGLHTS